MTIKVYRCRLCGREVLVRRQQLPGEPLISDTELRRRLAEEMRPITRGRAGRSDATTRLRDDVWLAIADGRQTPIPRDKLPSVCPACYAETSFDISRVIEG